MLWTVFPLSFTEEIRTLEGVSVAENANVKGLTPSQPVYLSQGERQRITKGETRNRLPENDPFFYFCLSAEHYSIHRSI